MDEPIRLRRPEDGWTENDGTQPVPDGVLIDLVVNGNFDKHRSIRTRVASKWCWAKTKHLNITHWRLAEQGEQCE